MKLFGLAVAAPVDANLWLAPLSHRMSEMTQRLTQAFAAEDDDDEEEGEAAALAADVEAGQPLPKEEGSASTAEQRLEATQMMRTAALSGDRVSLKAAIAWAEHSPIKAHLQQDLAMAKAKLLRMG